MIEKESNTEEYYEDNERYKAIFMTELTRDNLTIAATAIRNQERFVEIHGKKYGIAQLYGRIAEDIMDLAETLGGLAVRQLAKEYRTKMENFRNIKNPPEDNK